MSAWIGFWIMVAIIGAVTEWTGYKRRELKCKYPDVNFKWWEW